MINSIKQIFLVYLTLIGWSLVGHWSWPVMLKTDNFGLLPINCCILIHKSDYTLFSWNSELWTFCVYAMCLCYCIPDVYISEGL